MDEIGTVTVERKWDRDTDNPNALHILRADPRVRISTELLNGIRDDAYGPHWKLDLDGDVLTIRDDYGQRVIYRIRWDDYADGGYLAEWPD